MTGLPPVMVWPGLLIALALLAAFSWFLVRHAGLTLLMVLSPLPGYALSALATGRLSDFFCYLPGFIVAGFLADAIARLAATTPPRQAAGQSLRDLWPVFLAAFLLFIPMILLGPEALCCLAGEISAVAVTAFAATLFSYDENFVVRINRASEARIRTTERLDFSTQSRWGMSMGGIALVFSVLSFFGAQKILAAVSSQSVLFGSSGLAFLFAVLAATRNARRALAAVLALAPVILLVFAPSGRFLDSAIPLLPLAIAAMPVLFMAAVTAAFERNGDPWQTATQRGIARSGPAVAVTMLASGGAALLSGFLSRAAVVESFAPLLGGIAALILQPALTTMLHALFPRRVSLEDAFRRP